ncbi:PaaI family thioesterase [Desulfovibrio sp. OttesenSCG-928-C06]|nr:PaaI family thioesterase [Desulfovibrio sp. OttesenSCG-928-C06]
MYNPNDEASVEADRKKMMQAQYKGDQVVRALGIELVECRHGYGKAIMPLDGRQGNVLGIAHGGAIFTLADMAMGMAAYGSGYLCVTLNTNISFLKPGLKGPLVAEARQISESTKIGNIEVSVTDADGQLIAQASYMAYKKNPEHFREHLESLHAAE